MPASGAAPLRSAVADLGVIGVPVINRDLLAGADVPKREEGHLPAGHDSHEGIRVARVVDESRLVAAHRPIDGEIIGQADDFDRVLPAQPCLDAAAAADRLAGVERNLLARGESGEREAAHPVDSALPDFQLARHSDATPDSH